MDYAANRQQLREFFLSCWPDEIAKQYLKKERDRRQFLERILQVSFPSDGRLVWEPKDWHTHTPDATLYDDDTVDALSDAYPLWILAQGGGSGYESKIRPLFSAFRGSLTGKGFKPSRMMRQAGEAVRGAENNRLERETPQRIALSIALEDMVFASDYGSFESCYQTLGTGKPRDWQGSGRTYALVPNAAILLREEDKLVPHNYKDTNATLPKGLPDMPKKVGRRWLVFNGTPAMYAWREYGLLGWGILFLMDILKDKVFWESTPKGINATSDCAIRAYIDEGHVCSKFGEAFLIEVKTQGVDGHTLQWNVLQNKELAKCTRCKQPIWGEARAAKTTNPEDAIKFSAVCSKCVEECFRFCSGCDELWVHTSLIQIGQKAYCAPCAVNVKVCAGCFSEGRIERSVNGKDYCINCYNSLFIPCSICNRLLRTLRINQTSFIAPGKVACKPCRDKLYKNGVKNAPQV